ncbi:MAG: tRNA (pseudouridine(54)-N(1))-methyltransferase TrmY [Thermoplasmata archaeon]|nr:tRNA (pseudouridine(54)-N(1))-methyltransferase TrmY [Candidatus Sysuiplasma acidicola]MBX8645473.1 tRNA (pseudouridine(54)-N(1))-methyltransferase TrmY [Candidatus Sysuiplasma acidicola]
MDNGIQPGSRHYVVISHTVPADGDFSLNDLPGSGGRIDVIARCISSALLISNGIRRDASITICLSSGDRPVSVSVFGSSVRYLNPDERSTAALIRNALVKASRLEEGISSPGVYFSHQSLEEVMHHISGGCNTYYLSELGEPVVTFKAPSFMVLGDQKGVTAEEDALLARSQALKVSLSRLSLQSDQCITISNWIMDRVV